MTRALLVVLALLLCLALVGRHVSWPSQPAPSVSAKVATVTPAYAAPSREQLGIDLVACRPYVGGVQRPADLRPLRGVGKGRAVKATWTCSTGTLKIVRAGRHRQVRG